MSAICVTWIGFLTLSIYLIFGLAWLAGNPAVREQVSTWAGVAG